MLNLTFGEQVKIVLSRKGMTIKELAEQIEARTGKKMSRQNLTQRLGRDNFQEQDMRMIAEILGCSFQLSILASLEAEKAMVIEEELGRLAAKKEMKEIREEKKKEKIENVPEAAEEPAEEVIEAVEESVEEVAEAAPVMEEKAVEHVEKAKKEDTKYSNNSKYFQPIKQRKDLEEDREAGEINP